MAKSSLKGLFGKKEKATPTPKRSRRVRRQRGQGGVGTTPDIENQFLEIEKILKKITTSLNSKNAKAYMQEQGADNLAIQLEKIFAKLDIHPILAIELIAKSIKRLSKDKKITLFVEECTDDEYDHIASMLDTMCESTSKIIPIEG